MPTGCLINKKRGPGERPGVPHHFCPFRLQHDGGSLPFSRLFPNNCQNKTCQTRFAGRSFPTPYLLKLLVTFKGDLVWAPMGAALRLNPQRRGY